MDMIIGEDYMVLFWSHSNFSHDNNIVAPDYFLRLNDSSFLESPHVFSAFENRNNSAITQDKLPFKWTAGTVVRIFREQRIPKLGAKDPVSHTFRMFEVPGKLLDVTVWGAYHSEMSAHLHHTLLESPGTTVTLIGKQGEELLYHYDTGFVCDYLFLLFYLRIDIV